MLIGTIQIIRRMIRNPNVFPGVILFSCLKFQPVVHIFCRRLFQVSAFVRRPDVKGALGIKILIAMTLVISPVICKKRLMRFRLTSVHHVFVIITRGDASWVFTIYRSVYRITAVFCQCSLCLGGAAKLTAAIDAVQLYPVDTVCVCVGSGRFTGKYNVRPFFGNLDGFCCFALRKCQRRRFASEMSTADGRSILRAVIYRLPTIRSIDPRNGKFIVSIILYRKFSVFFCIYVKLSLCAVPDLPCSIFSIGTDMVYDAVHNVRRRPLQGAAFCLHRRRRLYLSVADPGSGVHHNAPHKTCLCDILPACVSELGRKAEAVLAGHTRRRRTAQFQRFRQYGDFQRRCLVGIARHTHPVGHGIGTCRFRVDCRCISYGADVFFDKR